MILGTAGGVIGIAIGSTGVGGVLLVPFLIYALGLPVHAAIAMALWSYLWSGLVAVSLYARRGSIPWPMAAWLCLAALPGAYVGNRLTAFLSGNVLQGLIALLLVAAGINALRPSRGGDAASPPLGRGMLMTLGGCTGIGSALVGAGGAFILVPLLVALEQPVLLAVGLGQVIQIPISAVASLANLREGLVDVASATILAAALSVGIAVGAPLAHALPQRALRRLLGLTMVVAGAATIFRLTFTAA